MKKSLFVSRSCVNKENGRSKSFFSSELSKTRHTMYEEKEKGGRCKNNEKVGKKRRTGDSAKATFWPKAALFGLLAAACCLICSAESSGLEAIGVEGKAEASSHLEVNGRSCNRLTHMHKPTKSPFGRSVSRFIHALVCSTSDH